MIASVIPAYDENGWDHIRRGMLRKIRKTFSLPSDGMQFDAALDSRLTAEIQSFLGSPEWRARCGKNAAFSKIPLDAEQTDAINNIAREIMRDYAQVFFLRTIAESSFSAQFGERNTRAQRPFDDLNSTQSLFYIFSNYVTRESLCKMKSLGFSDRSALSLTGDLVKNIVSICQYIPATCKRGVWPLADDKITTDEQAQKCILNIFEFAENEGKKLSNHYRNL